MSGLTAKPVAAACVLALTLGASRPANAQQSFSWNDYCTIGSLQFCASVEISLQPSSTTFQPVATLLTIRLRNLEGALGSTPWGLIGMNITGMTSTLNGSGGIYLPPNPPHSGKGAWEFEYWDFQNGNQGFQTTGIRFNPTQTAVVGCNTPTALNYGTHPFQHASTCGGSGWVEFSFNLTGAWSFNKQTQVGLVGYHDDTTPYGTQFSCTLDSTCIMVTPEPGTIALLSTGLVALGGAWRRRRKGTDAS